MADLLELMGVKPFIIGMIHTGPFLRGGPPEINELVEEAVRNALTLTEGGVDGIIVENYYDVPYPKYRAEPHVISSMTLIVREVVKSVNVPVGVNILRNCALDALAVAKVAGARMVRVNALSQVVVSDQGILEPVARELSNYRRLIGGSDIFILADVNVKHSAPLVRRPVGEVATETVARGGADAVIVTGSVTGGEVSLEELREVAEGVREFGKPVVVGSGVTPENAVKYLSIADGAIVGTYFKEGRMVSLSRVRKLVGVVKELRKSLK